MTSDTEHENAEHENTAHASETRGDAAHDAAVSGGTPDELATEAGSPGAGTVDDQRSADVVDGVLSPGSSATGSPTEPQ